MLDRELSVCQDSRVMTPQGDAEPLDEALVDIRSCVLTHPFDAKAARCEPLQDCLRRY
jgi:hypothetical protein